MGIRTLTHIRFQGYELEDGGLLVNMELRVNTKQALEKKRLWDGFRRRVLGMDDIARCALSHRRAAEEWVLLEVKISPEATKLLGSESKQKKQRAEALCAAVNALLEKLLPA